MQSSGLQLAFASLTCALEAVLVRACLPFYRQNNWRNENCIRWP